MGLFRGARLGFELEPVGALVDNTQNFYPVRERAI